MIRETTQCTHAPILILCVLRHLHRVGDKCDAYRTECDVNIAEQQLKRKHVKARNNGGFELHSRLGGGFTSLDARKFARC